MKVLKSLEQIVFNLTDENFDSLIQQTMQLFELNYVYSFNLIICRLVYVAFFSQKNPNDLYLKYLESIQAKEEMAKNEYKIINIFSNFMLKMRTQESYYLINKMIERNLIKADITKNINSKYFAHFKNEKEIKNPKLIWHLNHRNYDITEKTFFYNYEKLLYNNFELHKKLIQEGVNPNEIAKIIRNDEIEELQEISTKPNFNFNQTIEPSLYEKCSFINQRNISLIDYAAFFSAVKCFKFLLMNEAKVTNTGKYAIAGGNEEIIHLCEQNHSSFEGAYKTAIEFHRNNIFKYLYENHLEIFNINKLGCFCIKSANYEIISFLEKNGMTINDDIIYEAIGTGNFYLAKHFFQNNQIPKYVLKSSVESRNLELIKYIIEQGIDINVKDIYLFYLIFQNNIRKIFKLFETAFIWASFRGFTEIVQLLLEQEEIDINAKNIYLFYLILILIVSY